MRGDFFACSHAQARAKLGFVDDKPLVVSFWGSLGAAHMNEQMVDFIRAELSAGSPFHHIHAAGAAGYSKMQEALRDAGVDLAGTDVDLREYIYDMPNVMRAADLVVSRGGASTISELTALGMPSIIVPSPYVVNNHQEKNARVLEEAGGICLMLESESSGKALYNAAMEILGDSTKREGMRKAMLSLSVADATERIYHTVMALAPKAEKTEI